MIRLPLILLPAALLLLGGAPVSAGVVLSELQPDNSRTIQDEDGDASDWIELINPDATAAELGGMSLTDDPAVPAKWTFPATRLEPGASLLVWASGKNRAVSGAPLHTSFKLSSAGGYIGIFAPGGTVPVSAFEAYPAIPEDKSWGTSVPLVSAKLLAAGAPCRLHVPTAAVPLWQYARFDDSAWTPAATGIGYDRTFTSGVNFLPLLGAGGNVEAQMYAKAAGCYLRIPFQVENAGLIRSLRLSARFDDGFAAWLNGTRLDPPTAADTRSPANPQWSSLSSGARTDAESLIPAEFDVSSQTGLLRSGQNLLAVHVMNQSLSSSDLFFLPELSAETEDRSQIRTGRLSTATPGAKNLAEIVEGYADRPAFSVKRGFYSAPFTVELVSETPESAIRYTLNGSEPAATSPLYTAPLSISTTTVLRAATFRAGWLTSPSRTHTYIFPAAVVAQQQSQPAFPLTWGWEYNFSTGLLDSRFPVTADYEMDPAITGAADYTSLMLPALTQTFPVVSLSTPVDTLFGINGIYSNGRLTEGLEVPVSMEFFTTDHAEDWHENAGLRIHGGDAPLEHPKKPFRVYFRNEYGADKLRQPFFPGSPVDKFDRLQFRGGGHDGWAVPFGSGQNDLARHATYCRDRFLRQTEQDMGRLSPDSRWVHLYLNGLYWGIYDVHEVPGEDYFADHLGGEDAEWDVVEQPGVGGVPFDVVDGTADAMNTLLALVRPPSRAATDAGYAAIRQYIDPDEFIDHMIVQMWGAQNDWMGPVFLGTGEQDASRFFNKNWDAGRHSRAGTPGTFRWNVWDAEISMGNSLTAFFYPMREANFDHTRVGTPDYETGISGTPGPPAEIYNALRQNAAFRARFADRLQKHFFNGGAMSRERNTARLQALRDQLELPIVAESARWGDVNSGDPLVVTFSRNEHWREEMDWMRDGYIGTRNETVLDQFRSIGIWPETGAPTLSPPGGTLSPADLLSIAPQHRAAAIYYTLDGSDPVQPASTVENLLVPAAGSYRFRFATAASPGNLWKDVAEPADIASWRTGSGGIGYGGTTTFAPFIQTSVADMQSAASSLYTRSTFTLTAAQKDAMTRLILRLRIDDGCYVFLNGELVIRLNVPASGPVYNAVAGFSRTNTAAIGLIDLDVSSFIPSLLPDAENVLAVQLVNASRTDADALLTMELAGQATTDARIAPGAVLYTGPFPPGTGTVKARALHNGEWSPLAEGSYISGNPASASNLTISEISYNPVPGEAAALAGFTSRQLEFIELMNISAQTIDLAGCRFTDGIAFDFSAHSSVPRLGPGERLIIAADAAGFAMEHPGITPAGVFQNSTNLSNGGERITLLAADGAPIVDFAYDDAAPWPVAAAGGGATLVLIHPESDPDPVLPENWRASIAGGGTPGSTDADTFAAWQLRNARQPLGTTQPSEDASAQLLAYALGAPARPVTEPLSVRIGTVPGADGGQYLIVSYIRNTAADDVLLIPEWSSDLAGWAPLKIEAAPAVQIAEGLEELTFRTELSVQDLPRAMVRLSARLKAVE